MLDLSTKLRSLNNSDISNAKAPSPEINGKLLETAKNNAAIINGFTKSIKNCFTQYQSLHEQKFT